MDLLTAQISRAALRGNLQRLAHCAGGRVRLCAMVKADAYGHGMDIVAETLADQGVDFLAVARLEEAQRLRRNGIMTNLLLCEPAADPAGDSALADRLEAICRLRQLRVTVADAPAAVALSQMARRLGVTVAVHVKVDTGMGRGGVLADQAEPLARAVAGSPNLVLEGVYTHLATADEPDDRFARQQLDCFAALVRGWAGRGLRPPLVHAANSAALARFDHDWLTLARPGLAIYGYRPGEACPCVSELALEPVMRLTARLVFVKELPAGHAVGYGCTWRTDRPSRIGLAPIGYGDGYCRDFGNRAVMTIAGRPVPVVGRISMDQTTVDLSELPDGGRWVRPGAEVVVIDERPGAANSVESLARLAGTIPYEITCRLGQRISRVAVDSFDRGR